jgi:hypothetical protein
MDGFMRKSRGKPTPIIRFDGHIAGEREPCDLDGDRISKALAMGSMEGAEVRILINPESSPEEVGRMLEKILAWIAKEGFDPPYKRYPAFEKCPIPEYL